MITPLQMAKAEFERRNPEGDFTKLVAGYLTRGFVYAGDDAFILAMPTRTAWFVHIAAGDLRRFQELAPYRKPFVAWQRRGQGPIRRYRWDQFHRISNAINRHHSYGIDRFNPCSSVHGRGGSGDSASAGRPRP